MPSAERVVSLRHYGVLKGKAIGAKWQDAPISPHYQVHILASTVHYRITVNLMSQGDPSKLVSLVDTHFQHGITKSLQELDIGFTHLKSTAGGLAIDYVRGDLFNQKDMQSLPAKDLGEEIAHHVNRAITEPKAQLYAFGQRWGPEKGKADRVFGFTPGNGIHNIHMNQGNDASHRGDDGVWQDGALMFHFPSSKQWVAVFLAFQSQAWQTDDRAGRAVSEAPVIETESQHGLTESDHVIRMHQPYRQPGFDSEDVQGTQASKLVDLLDIENDAKAFASLITAKNLVPPLSVGIFADWGAGKSFFMRKIHHWVETIADQSKRAEAGNTAFCGNVVQIEFNAWHYLDADLWASLVTEIFEKLFEFEAGTADDAAKNKRKQLKDQLGTAKGLFEKAHAELTDAEQARNAAEKVLKEAISERERQEETVSRQLDLIVELTKDDKQVADQLSKLGKDLGIPEVLKSYATFEAKINDLRSLSDRAIAILIPMFNSPGGLKRLGWLIVALVVPGAIFWLLTKMPAVGISDMAALAMQATTTLGTVSGWLGKNLNDGSKLVSQLEESFNKVQNIRKKRIEQTTSKEQGNLQALIERETAAKRNFQEAQTRVESLQREIDEWQPGRLLSRFIEERSKAVDYQKRLGIISLVRRDFSRLSDLLEDAQKATEEAKVMPVQRIVLYIDDLDRCPADRVVEVLQAVHLLLSFRLFIVVVGVDYRWVSRSLCEHYDKLLTNDKTLVGQESGNSERTASSLDYLEKIFQVPFWLRRMSPNMCGSFLEGLLRSSIASKSTKSEQSGSYLSAYTQSLPVSSEAPVSESANKDRTLDSIEKSGEAPLSVGVEQTLNLDLMPPNLALDPREITFMKQLAPLLTRSPRSAKRFINTYRIIRAGISDTHLDRMLKEYGDISELCSIMFLLSILTGTPRIAELVFKAIRKGEVKDISHVIKGALQSKGNIHGQNSETVQLLEWLEAYARMDGQQIQLRDCQAWLPQVGQYAFSSPL